MLDKHAVINLNNQLKNLKKYFSHRNWLANEYFYITRPSVEVLKKYDLKPNVFSQIKNKYLLVILFPAYLVFSIILNLIYALLVPGKKVKIHNKNYPVFFVSHATIDNPSHANGDRIYGDLLKTRNSSSKNLVYFLNHTKGNNKTLSQRIKRSIDADFVLNSKNLPIWKMLYILIQNVALTLKIFVKHFSTILISKNGKHIIKILYFQISRKTTANLVIRENIFDILQQTKCNNLVLTLEGHAYESVILELVSSLKSNLKVFMFQHSPISHGQMALRDLIEGLNPNQHFLCSSPLVAKYLKLSFPEGKNSIYVIGSPKYEQRQKVNNIKKKIVLAPEGLNSSLKEFLYLAKILILQNHKKIVLRIHPALKVDIQNRYILRKLSKKDVFEISQSSLKIDLADAKYCIFRASSVGLESLAYQTIPVFYGNKWENENVNPLKIIDTDYIFLDSENLKLLKSLKPKKDVTKNWISYYSKLDISKFFDLTNQK